MTEPTHDPRHAPSTRSAAVLLRSHDATELILLLVVSYAKGSGFPFHLIFVYELFLVFIILSAAVVKKKQPITQGVFI